jgi:hypothetical protein
MLRDAGMHVAYPGRITYNYDQDARRSLVVCGFRSAFRSSEQVCSLARDVSHGLLTNSHFVRSPEGPNNQNTERSWFDHRWLSVSLRTRPSRRITMVRHCL